MTERIPGLYSLRAFEVAARFCSFSKAANELSVTQSAVSHHVKSLEELFGCSLFERRGPKLNLTDQGRLLSRELKTGFKIIESACELLKVDRNRIRLKAPSTLTIRWLLKALDNFKKANTHCSVQVSSVWMDIDEVDFYSEPYDCAILLGTGNFGPDMVSFKLFDEWLIPVCSPDYMKCNNPTLAFLNDCELLHPSTDRRDWRRWLRKVNGLDNTSLEGGQLFDTLDQGIAAALQGLGVSVADLVLVSQEVEHGRLQLPFNSAVATGDGYYMTWLKGNPKAKQMNQLREYLLTQIPSLSIHDVDYLE
ncbi:LysR substrate-binding domain-containing protein [Pseudomonas sp. 681]|uniref:LysR substrate-binding domain-containing protein n=1 Tax=Pseudomonas fungipugnans TaxID=3024217 RepID=A0ABT6QWB7_9PSED|nr:LysR substrate-binding domain-containing protein [Pseudomonas sp. 681]MDI2595205.1 LysR substrate-binding domain-containing protein [Pseudomonas sp. 681]